MKKLVIIFVFLTFFFFSKNAVAQDINKYNLFEQKCDSLITEINDFDPISGNSEYDLYIINNVIPRTTDYILMMKEVIKKSKEDEVEIDFEFIIDGLINELEDLKEILK